MPRPTRKIKLGLFGIYMLARFALLVPFTSTSFNKRSYKYIIQNQPKKQFRRWSASSKNSTRILTACALALHLIEKHSPFPGTCLSRSIVLWSTLKRYSIDAVLQIGVKFESNATPANNGSFAAHAWVEVDGKPINAPQDVASTYASFSAELLIQNFEKLTFPT